MKNRYSKAIIKVILVIFIILAVQLTLFQIQDVRYRFEPGADDNYGCMEMSRDAEAFFEGVLGIRVLQVRGYAEEYEEVIEYGQLTHKPHYIAHQWIILDFGLFTIPYESTHLIPLNSMWYHDYENLRISEGHYIGHTKVTDNPEDLIFNRCV